MIEPVENPRKKYPFISKKGIPKDYCPACGKLFSIYYMRYTHTPKYCERIKEISKIVDTCLFCGKEFRRSMKRKSRHGFAKFCCKKCRVRYNYDVKNIKKQYIYDIKKKTRRKGKDPFNRVFNYYEDDEKSILFKEIIRKSYFGPGDIFYDVIILGL
jgi:hypothetical protein